MAITLVNNGTTFNIHHADHGITIQQMDYICGMFFAAAGNDARSLVIEQVDLPVEHGTVPCGLVGPEMGDEPVTDEDVIYYPRGNRDYDDRMHLTRRPRKIDFVQCIGATRWVPKKKHFLPRLVVDLYTVYGGPLAPQNPCDPTCHDVVASNRFWAEHALCG